MLIWRHKRRRSNILRFCCCWGFPHTLRENERNSKGGREGKQSPIFACLISWMYAYLSSSSPTSVQAFGVYHSHIDCRLCDHFRIYWTNIVLVYLTVRHNYFIFFQWFSRRSHGSQAKKKNLFFFRAHNLSPYFFLSVFGWMVKLCLCANMCFIVTYAEAWACVYANTLPSHHDVSYNTPTFYWFLIGVAVHIDIATQNWIYYICHRITTAFQFRSNVVNRLSLYIVSRYLFFFHSVASAISLPCT